jgi:hypothetical protein
MKVAMGGPKDQGVPFHLNFLMCCRKRQKTAEKIGRREDNPRSSGLRELCARAWMPQSRAN